MLKLSKFIFTTVAFFCIGQLCLGSVISQPMNQSAGTKGFLGIHGPQKSSKNSNPPNVIGTPNQAISPPSGTNCVRCPVSPPCTCQDHTSLGGFTYVSCAYPNDLHGIAPFPQISNVATCLPVAGFFIYTANGILHLPSKAFSNFTNVQDGFIVNAMAARLTAANDAFSGLVSADSRLVIENIDATTSDNVTINFDQLLCSTISISGVKMVNFSGASSIRTVTISEVEGQEIIWPSKDVSVGSITDLTIFLVNNDLRSNFTQLHLEHLSINGDVGAPASLTNNVAEKLKYFHTDVITKLELNYFNDVSLATMPYVSQFPSLTELSLRSANITTSEDLREILKLKELRKLSLSANNIAQVDTNNFTNLPNLQYLDLIRNPIAKIAKNAFANMTSLGLHGIGYLSHVPISAIGEGAFTNISTLEIAIGSNLNLSIDAFRQVRTKVTISFTGNATVTASRLAKPPKSTALVLMICVDSFNLDCSKVCPTISDQFCDVFPVLLTDNLCGGNMNICGE